MLSNQGGAVVAPISQDDAIDSKLLSTDDIKDPSNDDTIRDDLPLLMLPSSSKQSPSSEAATVPIQRVGVRSEYKVSDSSYLQL
ncbi:unnamed protein product [Phytophthora lilii]|uniref:Unnamed protein product n=1 Tax=Phytophthora lilii TaxID=2077276 RepID=A0A9W6WW85_9STRA|nr:unnamed protein product [Phytophthora lilii]